jgi:hypothetical protein
VESFDVEVAIVTGHREALAGAVPKAAAINARRGMGGKSRFAGSAQWGGYNSTHYGCSTLNFISMRAKCLSTPAIPPRNRPSAKTV